MIHGIAVHLPPDILTNEALAQQFPHWQVEKIAERTGIHTRHRVAPGETALDLAEAATRKLLNGEYAVATGSESSPVDAASIDALLYCTQSPDYLLPTNACLLQHRLGLPTTTMALDYNLGCSGYVYGLGLARGLVLSGQAQRVLLVTTEVTSGYMAEDDRSVQTLFGDAATATLIDAAGEGSPGGHIGVSVFGTDGAGGPSLLVTGAGYDGRPLDKRSAGRGTKPTVFLDGPEIFSFSLSRVPKLLDALYQKAGIGPDAIDCFVFHQANRYMLEHLRRKLGIPQERFVIDLGDVGNTSSNTVAIALSRTLDNGRITPGQRIMLVGFGVGFSWGGVLVDWR